MPIETGRWQNISREDIICHLCRDVVGDEYHYLFLCKNEAVFENLEDAQIIRASGYKI
jgi:hypothetical protein